MERWEDDLIELANILREEIPPAYWKVSVSVAAYHTARLKEPSEQGAAELERTSEAFDRDRDELWGLVTKANRLKQRVRLIERDSPYWPELSDSISKVSRTVAQTTLRNYEQGPGEIDALLLHNEQEHGKAMKRARDLLDVIAIPMKPPPGRVARWVTSVIGRSSREIAPD